MDKEEILYKIEGCFGQQDYGSVDKWLERIKERAALSVVEDIVLGIAEFLTRNKEIKYPKSNDIQQRAQLILKLRKRAREKDEIEGCKKATEALKQEEIIKKQKEDELEKIGFIRSYNIKCFYHFTEKSNLQSILTHGLCSFRRIRRLKIPNIQYCSDIQSRSVDRERDLDKYVHLSFTPDHPMMRIAKERGRLKEPYILKIKPEIILPPNVQLASGIAYAKNTKIYLFNEAKKILNWNFLYKSITPEELNIGRKYEILIPHLIEPKFIILD